MDVITANQQASVQKNERIEARAIEAVASKFPITVKDFTIAVTDLKIQRPSNLYNYAAEEALKDKGQSLYGQVTGSFISKNNKTGETNKTGRRVIVNIPYTTDRGTFIINGNEKVITKQMLLKPGVYTTDANGKVESFFFLKRGKNLKMQFDPEALNLKIELSGHTYNAVTFMRILGITDNEITSAVGNLELAAQLFNKAQSKNLQNETLKLWNELPCKRFPSNPDGKYPGFEKGMLDVQHYFFDLSEFGDTGQQVMGITLGHSNNNPDRQVFLKALNKVMNIARSESQAEREELSDDKDDIRFQDVRIDEDQIAFNISRRIEQITDEMVSGRGAKEPLNRMNEKEIGDSLRGFLTQGKLSDLVDQTNPLLMSAATRKITSLGEGGLNVKAAGSDARNLQTSAYGKIDPIETPEGGKIGLVTHLTHFARAEGLTIKSDYYKVKNGTFTKSPSNIVSLEPIQESSVPIAFYDPNSFVVMGNKVQLPTKVWARTGSKIELVDASKVKYVDVSPHVIWGDGSSLVPFSAHNDGNRMLMASNMQKQALILKNREEPLVQNALDESHTTTYEEDIAKKYAFPVHSPIDGEVIKVSKTSMSIRDNAGEVKDIQLYDYFPLNKSHYINNTPVVKTGDKVKKDQLLAEGWQTKNGKLALGLNARVAYMPWKGFNYEDGYVISESFAERMATEEVKEIEAEIGPTQIGGEEAIKILREKGVISSADLSKLDGSGIIKVGEKVGAGTILVAVAEESKSADRPEQAAMRSLFGMSLLDRYKDKSSRILGYTSGEVIKVKNIPQADGGMLVKVTIFTSNIMKEGDKIVGRHGNKGVIVKIEDDTSMPIAPDGKPIEVIYSPLGVPSRKNLGQLYELSAGLIASNEGKPFKVYNFDRSEAKKVEAGLKKLGMPEGKMELIDPETGKPYENPVTVGVQYMMKLHHKVDEKIHARNIGRINMQYNSPVKSIGDLAGEKGNPQKFGEMEIRALEASKAVNIINEATQLKSDAAGDREERKRIFDALAFGNTDGFMDEVPMSFRVFSDYSKALGLNLKPRLYGKDMDTLDSRFNTLAIAPMRKADVVKLSRGEVSTGGAYASYKKGDKPEVGGLFDPNIFGEDEHEQRNYWGHINMSIPMPNPLLLQSNANPYSTLLDMESTKIKSILQDNVGVILDGGDTEHVRGEIVPMNEIKKLEAAGKNLKYEVSGLAIKELLGDIDVDAEYERVQKALISAPPNKKPDLYKKIRTLRMLKENNMKATDLMVEALPILPAGLRPITPSGGMEVIDDMNILYKDLITSNNQLKSIKGSYQWDVFDPTTKHNALKNYYKQLEGVMGVNKTPILYRGKQLQGVATNLSDKDGLIRGRMMSKTVDYSGRSVIIGNPSLGLDEAAIPVDMAVKLYQPFVIRELFRTGKAHSKEAAIVKSSNPEDPDTVDVLETIMKNRPVILNRAPSLHKYSLQAFNPTLTKTRAIELNPLVTKMFGGDFDGDTMGIHIPLRPEAVKEANELLKPSKSLINPTNGKLVAPIQNEMALGIFYLTIDKYKRPLMQKESIKTYMLYDEMLRDYKKGVTRTYDIVTFNSKVATVGRHLVNGILPPNHQNYAKVFNAKVVNEMLEKIIAEDAEKAEKSTASNGTQTAVVVLEKLKNLGFLASTKSGLSISVSDLKTVGSKSNLIAQADKEVSKDPSKLISIYKGLNDEMEDQISNTLGEKNPVYMLMESGAKGKKDQISRMSNMVGLSMDITNKVIPIPIKSSFKEGLNPTEMWVHAFDSRRGLADRALSTALPGQLTREVYSSVQDYVITTPDCGDTEGMYMDKNNSSILGRFLCDGVKDVGGVVVYKRGTLINSELKDSLARMTNITQIKVRTPMKCKATKGVCQKCYGTYPGTAKVVDIGDPVGIIASQAIGEPTAQGVMRTFHGGGASEGAKSVAAGLPRVIELFHASKTPMNKSELSPYTGEVLEVNTELVSKVIKIRTFENGKPRIKSIKVPLTKDIVVKAGQNIKVGDKLTEEFGALVPSDVMKMRGLDATQDYLTSELNSALSANDINPKHLELTVGKLTSKVTVNDSASSPWLPGQVVSKNLVDAWNTKSGKQPTAVSISELARLNGATVAKTYRGRSRAVIVQEGEVLNLDTIDKLRSAGFREVEVMSNAVTYNPEVFGVISEPKKGTDNWFSQMGFQDAKAFLSEGAIYGKEDLLDEPRSRQMAGKLVNIGTGYNKWLNEWGKLKDSIKNNPVLDLFE